jgi:hypothetical protein
LLREIVLADDDSSIRELLADTPSIGCDLVYECAEVLFLFLLGAL